MVASSTVSNGKGTIYILQQNFGGSGYGNSNDLVPMTVSGGNLQDAFGMHATGWLHAGTTGSGIESRQAAVANADGHLEVFARGSNGAIWHDVQSAPNSSTWSTWSKLATTTGFASDPYAVQNADGHLEVFARKSDGSISQDVQSAPNSSSWSGWSTLDQPYVFA